MLRMGLQRLFGLYLFDLVNQVVTYVAWRCFGQLLLSVTAIHATPSPSAASYCATHVGHFP